MVWRLKHAHKNLIACAASSYAHSSVALLTAAPKWPSSFPLAGADRPASPRRTCESQQSPCGRCMSMCPPHSDKPEDFTPQLQRCRRKAGKHPRGAAMPIASPAYQLGKWRGWGRRGSRRRGESRRRRQGGKRGRRGCWRLRLRGAGRCRGHDSAWAVSHPGRRSDGNAGDGEKGISLDFPIFHQVVLLNLSNVYTIRITDAGNPLYGSSYRERIAPMPTPATPQALKTVAGKLANQSLATTRPSDSTAGQRPMDAHVVSP